MNGKKRGNADTFDKQLAHAMTRALRRNHRHVDERGRQDLAEMNVEPMSEHQCLTGAKVRLNGRLVDLLLSLIRNQNHDDV